MQPAGMWIDHRRERIEVGTLELGQLPILHEKRRQFVSLISKLLQHACIGGGPRRRALRHREAEPREQNLPELKIGIDVELHAGRSVDLPFDSFTFPTETCLE